MITRLPIPSKGAAALGRLGGLKGGKARTAKLTAEQRRELARKAVNARWAMARKKAQQKDLHDKNKSFYTPFVKKMVYDNLYEQNQYRHRRGLDPKSPQTHPSQNQAPDRGSSLGLTGSLREPKGNSSILRSRNLEG